MDKELELAVDNPQEFLSKPQPNREWDMSIEDIARSINYNPYKSLATKSMVEPEKYSWVSSILAGIGSSVESIMSESSQATDDILGMYYSPNMTQEQADRLTEDVIYARNFAYKAKQAEDVAYAKDHPELFEFSQGIGSFITFVLAEAINPTFSTYLMYSSSKGQMSEQLADKYIEETGSVRGYAERKKTDDMLSTGFAVLNTAIERGLGMEKIVGRFIREPAKYGKIDYFKAARSQLNKQALKKTGEKALEGFVQEGVLEEAPQSYLEDATMILAGYGAWEDLLSKESFRKAAKSAWYGGIIGAGAGATMFNVSRARVKRDIAQWADEHKVKLTDLQVTQAADTFINKGQEALLNDLTTRAELKTKHGKAFEILVDKVKEQIKGTGQSLPEGQDLDKFARVVAKTIQIPAQNLSLWSNIPVEDYLNAANIRVINGMWELEPLQSSQEVKSLLDKQKAIIKEQNKLKKLGTENINILDNAKRRKNELQVIYDNLVRQESIESVKTFRKKQNIDYVKAKDLLPEQTRSIEGVKEATDEEDFVVFAGKKIPVSYEVVELDSIQPSHINGEINKNYTNKELQNRASRGTTIDVADLRNKALDFTPELVLTAPTSAQGAPITNAKGEVIAGNGRAEIIRMAYAENPEGAEKYKKALEKLGFNLSGMNKPILIRRNTTMNEEQQISAADISNIQEASAFDAASRAKQDSKYLKDSASITDFASKLPMSERRGLMLNNGTWNMRAVRQRYEEALLSWLCGNDTKLYENLVLGGSLPQKIIEPLVANGNAIVDLQEKYPDIDIRADIYGALVKYQRTNKDNFTSVMQEQELNGRDVMPENVVLWNFIFNNNTTIKMFFDNYTKTASANREAVNAGEDMFGQKVAPLSKKDLYAQALKKTDEIRSQIATESNKKYDPLFTETGEITDANLQSAFISYQNQFNTPSNTGALFQKTFDIADENARLDEKYPEYKGETINIDGKERTVYNSNGDRIAKSKEALTNFWNWFGDSKVVDEQGRPLVVYHGTNAEFDTFDENLIGKWDYGFYGKGFYFTDHKYVAEDYAKSGAFDDGGTATVMPVYLNLQNPFFMDYRNDNGISDEKHNRLVEQGYDGVIAVESRDLRKEGYEKELNKAKSLSVEHWQLKDYEGNIVGRVLPYEYVAWKPNQIKSVDNRGTFSSDTGNIYWQGSKTPNAWYDPELQIIALTKKWNNLSLVHEMHHRYLGKLIDVYNQAQNGLVQMTELGKQEIKNLFDMLDIADPMHLTAEELTVAQERFAAMTEAYLSGLGVQENQNQVYKDFLAWIPEKYKSILNIGYLNEKNEIVNPLLDQSAIDFFNRWFGEPQMPALPTSPISQSLINPTDDKDEIIPSSQKEMNDREIKWGVDSAEQIEADKKLYAAIDEDTPNDLRAAIDGAKVELHNMPVEDAVSMPQIDRERWFKTGVENAQERMAIKAKDYVEKNKEHAIELALADPEISTVYDAPVDRAWLIRAVMDITDKTSEEYAIMYDNLATYRSMSGSTLGLTNDMSQKAYLDAKREIENSREMKAVINYAGNNRGAWSKWTGDIKSFINARVGKILATEAGSPERKVAIQSFIEEAKTKFSGNTENAILNQLDLTGVNARSKAAFIKWAEKTIKQAVGVGLDNATQKKLIDASMKAQQAMLAIDNSNSAISSAAARDLRNWQILKDELKKSNFGKFDKFNNTVNNLMGGYVPSAMLMSFNTLFVANLPSTAINNAIIRSSMEGIYKKQLVSKSVLKAEEKRIRDIYKSSGMNIAQMEKPTSPSLMHGEKYMGQEKSKWYDFTFKVLSWGDNLFRIPTFVETLGRIASKNANGDAKLAEEKFRMYSQLNTTDEEAKLARKQALAISNMAVFTQDGILSTGLNHVRDSINKMSRGLLGLDKEGFGLGNLLAPFLKTGANVVEMGITGAIAPIRTVAFGLKKLNGKEIPEIQKIALRSDWKVFAFTALSVALLSALTSDDDDLYIEPYEPGQKYDPNRPYDSINIAGLWIKLDTFGVFSVPIRVAVKFIKDKNLFTAYGFGLQEAIGETPLLNNLTTDPTYMFKKPGKWAQGFGYNMLNKFVPAQAKPIIRAGSRAIGVEYKPEFLGDYLQRRFNRNYGLDGVEPTTNDYINIFTNRLKFIE